MGNALLCCETERPEDRKKKEKKANSTMAKKSAADKQEDRKKKEQEAEASFVALDNKQLEMEKDDEEENPDEI